MIQTINFEEEYIYKLKKQSKRDPILIERTIYAFGLLEAITRVGMPFVFKGGTCLMLLLEHPRRLSTDIDIVVEPGTDVMHYIERAAAIFPFLRFEEQRRVGKNKVEKRHFKFIYNSPIHGDQLYILLDILFEKNNYERLVEREIKNDLLVTEPEYLKVKIPSVSCVLGDKLTAFAPHTTGILLGGDKNMEIMKQLYDVSILLDEFDDFEETRCTYSKVIESEIAYRDIKVTQEDCLRDTLEASICIASRGKVNPEEYPMYVQAIRDLRGHVYSENYSPEIAVGRAAKVIYMVACMLSGTAYERVEDFREFADEKLILDELMSLKYLRKANPEAYAYVIKADALLR